MQRAIPIMISLSVALLPMAAAADKPGHAGKGPNKKIHRVDKSDHDRRGKNVRRGDHRIYAADCPPGLAKKSPRCVPPGQAKKQWPVVGRVVRGDNVHYVTRPGLYGLGYPPDGSRYAIVNGHLVRVDASTQRVLSIIRLVNAILD